MSRAVTSDPRSQSTRPPPQSLRFVSGSYIYEYDIDEKSVVARTNAVAAEIKGYEIANTIAGANKTKKTQTKRHA